MVTVFATSWTWLLGLALAIVVVPHSAFVVKPFEHLDLTVEPARGPRLGTVALGLETTRCLISVEAHDGAPVPHLRITHADDEVSSIREGNEDPSVSLLVPTLRAAQAALRGVEIDPQNASSGEHVRLHATCSDAEWRTILRTEAEIVVSSLLSLVGSDGIGELEHHATLPPTTLPPTTTTTPVPVDNTTTDPPADGSPTANETASSIVTDIANTTDFVPVATPLPSTVPPPPTFTVAVRASGLSRAFTAVLGLDASSQATANRTSTAVLARSAAGVVESLNMTFVALGAPGPVWSLPHGTALAASSTPASRLEVVAVADGRDLDSVTWRVVSLEARRPTPSPVPPLSLSAVPTATKTQARTLSETIQPIVITPTLTEELPIPNATWSFDVGSSLLLRATSLLADPNSVPVFDYLADKKRPNQDVDITMSVRVQPSTFVRQTVGFRVDCDRALLDDEGSGFFAAPRWDAMQQRAAGVVSVNITAPPVVPLIEPIPVRCTLSSLTFRLRAARLVDELRGGFTLLPQIDALRRITRFHPRSNVDIDNNTVAVDWEGAEGIRIVDDLPPLPFEDPPATPSRSARDAFTTMALLAGLGSAFAGRIGVATYPFRADATLRVVECHKTAWDMADDTVPVSWHPLRFRFGDGPLSQFAGACLANASLLVLLLVAQFAVATLVSCFADIGLVDACALLRCPGLSSVALVVLLYPTVAAAVTILRVPTPDDTSQRFVAVYGILVLFALITHIGYHLTAAFAADFYTLPRAPPPPTRAPTSMVRAELSSDADSLDVVSVVSSATTRGESRASSSSDPREARDSASVHGGNDSDVDRSQTRDASESSFRNKYDGNDGPPSAPSAFVAKRRSLWDTPSIRRRWPTVVRTVVGSGWWIDARQTVRRRTVGGCDGDLQAGGSHSDEENDDGASVPTAGTSPASPEAHHYTAPRRFVERHGITFAGTGERRQWACLVDLMVCIVAGCCVGANPTTRPACAVINSMLAGTSLFYLAVLVALRPFAAPLDMWSAGVIAALQAMADVAAFARVAEDSTEPSMVGTVAVWCALLADLLVVLRFAAVVTTELFRRHLQLSWEAAAIRQAQGARLRAHRRESGRHTSDDDGMSPRRDEDAAGVGIDDTAASPLLVVPSREGALPCDHDARMNPLPRNKLSRLLSEDGYSPRGFY